MMENALQLAMEIVKEEKYWEEKKTNRLILTIFKELGETSPLVHKYRRMLQRILY
jgi:thioredoxin-like negative regulator of GroEL